MVCKLAWSEGSCCALDRRSRFHHRTPESDLLIVLCRQSKARDILCRLLFAVRLLKIRFRWDVSIARSAIAAAVVT